MVDFEIAMWEGIQKVFPNTMIYACYFHFKQATLRWMRGNIDFESIIFYRSTNGKKYYFRDSVRFDKVVLSTNRRCFLSSVNFVSRKTQ